MSALYALPHGWRGVVCRWLGARKLRPASAAFHPDMAMHPDLGGVIYRAPLPGAVLTDAQRFDAMADDLAAVRRMVEELNRRPGPAGDWQT